MKKSTRLLTAILPAVATVGSGVACSYFYNYAFKSLERFPKGSAANPEIGSKFYPSHRWFEQQPKEDWWLHTDDPKQQIHAYFLPNQNSHKVAVIAHGYKGSAASMAASAQLFYNEGYTVLVPDDRAHGLSGGKYINFGWLDRLDYSQWLDHLIARLGSDIQIVLYGISMGGATVMMMSGDVLPPQVKAIVEDCGYSSIEEELAYQLKRGFKLPKYPLIPMISRINKLVLGFSLRHSSAVEQLHKNKTPIFFIHGAKDTYVPTEMCYQNFEATDAPKDMWIVPNAEHAQSYWVDPVTYHDRVVAFLKPYIPYDN